MNEQELTITQDQTNSLVMARPPEKVLAEAKMAAEALQGVIKGKEKPVIFNGAQYLEFEDWQVLGRFYGLTSKVVNTTPVDFGGVRGFEARAVVLDMKTGMEISAADAMCLNDEEKWSSRPKYEWKGSVKTKIGEVPVPMFQLRSMAQTRACAKALRNVLAWVVVLAGYKPTPAEEMDGVVDAKTAAPAAHIQPPARKSESVQNGEVSSNGDQARKISEKQRARFFAIWKGSGKTEAQVKDYLMDKIGTINSADIPVDLYEQFCQWAEKK